MGDRLTGLSRLGREVSRDLEETRVASGGASRVRAKLVARAPRNVREPRLRLRRIAAALAIAAAVVLAIAFARPKRELSFAVGAGSTGSAGSAESQGEQGEVGAFISAPPSHDVPLSFSDGTRIVLAPSTRARVASITSKGARLLVESGRLHADVVHTGDARWAVEAGPFEVRVTGTSFDVTWDPKDESIVVALAEGSVFVTGCSLGEGRRVVRGEELRVSCKPSPAAAPAATVTTPDTLPDAPPAATTSAVPPAAVPKPIASAAKPSAAELLASADAARYGGEFDRASDALLTVRRRFGGTDAAASAAFELGRIAFDVRRDFAGAGDWFDTYLRERPNGALAREALGRALEARHRAGDATHAEQLAVRYLSAYPDGPHARLARKLTIPDGGAP